MLPRVGVLQMSDRSVGPSKVLKSRLSVSTSQFRLSTSTRLASRTPIAFPGANQLFFNPGITARALGFLVHQQPFIAGDLFLQLASFAIVRNDDFVVVNANV